MNSYPLVSIITPSLNQGAFIEGTLQSVWEQDYPNIEHIVMDGGSTDGTVDKLKAHASKHKRAGTSGKNVSFRWVSTRDRGQADAINKGMKMARGDILCYLNSDDLFLRGAITRVATIFAKNPSACWVTGDYVIVDNKGERIQSYIAWYKKAARTLHIPLTFMNSVIQPSTFWRRSLMRKAGLFDAKLQYTFDYDYWLRLSRCTKPFVLEARVSAFRIHAKSKSGSMYERQFDEELKVLRRYTNSKIMLKLHKIHNALIVGVYSRIK